ncbi:MAG: 50S ribosomal protein L21 [Planctomycetota bacterium]
MYAVIADRGKQYFVAEGERVRIDRRTEAAGERIVFDRVLLVSGKDGVRAGAPVVDGVSVEATVLGEFKDRKVIVFKKKRRKMYRRKQGHRQRYTDLRVDRIG